MVRSDVQINKWGDSKLRKNNKPQPVRMFNLAEL